MNKWIRIFLKILGIGCFLVAAFVLLMAYASFTTEDIGAAFGIFCLLVAAAFVAGGFFAFKKSKPAVSSPIYYGPGRLPETPATDPVPNEPPAAVKTEPEKISAPTPSPAPAKEEPKKKNRFYHFHAAGVYYHKNDIVENLLFENSEYDLKKSEIIDFSMVDEYIYKYEKYFGIVELVPEPDNPHDKNAIKVIVDNVHVGYVPADITEKVKNILDTKDIVKIDCEIYGGPYKVLPDEDSSIERGSTDFKCDIFIEYK